MIIPGLILPDEIFARSVLAASSGASGLEGWGISFHRSLSFRGVVVFKGFGFGF